MQILEKVALKRKSDAGGAQGGRGEGGGRFTKPSPLQVVIARRWVGEPSTLRPFNTRRWVGAFQKCDDVGLERDSVRAQEKMENRVYGG